MNGLDLFSGIGGITLALKHLVTPIAYCENDRYAQSVLLLRMATGELPRAPIWNDIKTLDFGKIGSPDNIDIIYGGFPCQDISVAGTGRGMEAGSRSGLFSEIIRLTEEIRPTFVFLENVPAIRTRGLARVIHEFTALRYDCRWTIVSAQEVGAVHIRERWFLLAHSDGIGLREKCGSKVGRDYTQRSRPLESDSQNSQGGTSRTSEGLTKPTVDRTGDGIPNRLDRHRALGNSVVPAQAREAFERLCGLK